VVGGFPDKLVFRVPDGYSLAAATADGAAISHGMSATGLLEITLAGEESHSVAWSLRFE